MIPKEQILTNQTVTIKGISYTPVILPMAKLKNYRDWIGNWDVAISDQIPAPCLIESEEDTYELLKKHL